MKIEKFDAAFQRALIDSECVIEKLVFFLKTDSCEDEVLAILKKFGCNYIAGNIFTATDISRYTLDEISELDCVTAIMLGAQVYIAATEQ